MQVALRHPHTGSFKFIDTGWSWPIFLGAGFFGLPLFFRGMALWGTVMLVLWFLQLAVPLTAGGDVDMLGWILSLAVLGACVFLGARGNALSARHFFACGYEFAYPDGLEARMASESWGLEI